MKIKTILLAFVYVLFLNSCATHKVEIHPHISLSESEMVEWFNSFNPQWRKAILENNASYIIDRYDDNAIIGIPNQEFIIGKKAIANHWNRLVGFIDDFSYETQKIGGNPNDIIFENGMAFTTYTIGGQQITDTSKYLFVWKYIGNKEYEVLSEMFNDVHP